MVLLLFVWHYLPYIDLCAPKKYVDAFSLRVENTISGAGWVALLL